MASVLSLPCKLGSIVYIVRDFNSIYDKTKAYTTKYGTKITIEKFKVECFIIDDDGVHIAENGHDGYNLVTTYNHLSLEDEYGDCKIFFNYTDAYKFIASVI